MGLGWKEFVQQGQSLQPEPAVGAEDSQESPRVELVHWQAPASPLPSQRVEWK